LDLTSTSLLSTRTPLSTVTVTRLIRIAYGDYKLDTIPPGMAIPVPYKPVATQKAKGSLVGERREQISSARGKHNSRSRERKSAAPVTWVTSAL
jgi:hypothetical protein